MRFFSECQKTAWLSHFKQFVNKKISRIMYIMRSRHHNKGLKNILHRYQYPTRSDTQHKPVHTICAMYRTSDAGTDLCTDLNQA